MIDKINQQNDYSSTRESPGHTPSPHFVLNFKKDRFAWQTYVKVSKNEFEKVINSKDAFWINFNMNLATFWVLGVKFLKIRRKKCPDRRLTDGYGVLFIIYLVFGLIWEIGSVWLILISLFHANLLSLSKFQWTEYFLNFRWFGLIRPHPLMTLPIIIKTSIQQTV